MIHVQLLTYCRLIQIWTLFFSLKLTRKSPLFSLLVTVPIHLKKIEINSKRIGILLLDIIQISCILFFSKKLYVIENLNVFFLYLSLLTLMKKSPLNLYNIDLREDDLLYANESFSEYVKRIFGYFLEVVVYFRRRV